MTESVQRSFWRDRAESDRPTRWTGEDMLAQDLAIVSQVLQPGSSLLDVGSGSGDLFLPLLDQLSAVMEVDRESALLARIPPDPRIRVKEASIVDFVPDQSWDVALLFGVVPYLSVKEERTAYAALRSAVPSGVVVVKNQCGRTGEVLVDGWSEELGKDYWARYRAVTQQEADLAVYFDSVEVVAYPEHLNKWKNTAHYAFVCR